MLPRENSNAETRTFMAAAAASDKCKQRAGNTVTAQKSNRKATGKHRLHLLGLAKVTPWKPEDLSIAECFLFRRSFTSLCTKLLSSHVAGSPSPALQGAKNLRDRESSWHPFSCSRTTTRSEISDTASKTTAPHLVFLMETRRSTADIFV